MKSVIITTTCVSVLAAVLIMSGTSTFTNVQKVNAQMGSSNMTGVGNMTGGGMMMGGGPNITGSIKMSSVIGNALSSQIKVGLSQSAMTAEQAVGNNSHAVAAHFGVDNGYLTITVWVVDGSYNIHKVIVDAGNGKVLFNQPISQGESMMMHGMMMGGGDMMHGDGSHMMNGGPGMSKPWSQ